VAHPVRIAAIIAATIAALSATSADPGRVPEVFIAGVECEFTPPAQVVDGQLLAPLGPTLTAHGIKIKLSNDKRRLEITGAQGTNVTLAVADGALKVDGEPAERVVPPRLIDGRWLLPVRPICRALGFYIHADETGERLFIDPKVSIAEVKAEDKRVEVLLQCAARVQYRCSRLKDPERLVIDLLHAAMATPAQERELTSSIAAKVRWSQFVAGEAPVGRVVLELTGPHPYRLTRPKAGQILLSVAEKEEALSPAESVSEAIQPPPAHVMGATIEADGWSAVILSDRPLEYSLSAQRDPYGLIIDCPNSQLSSSRDVVRSPDKGVIGRIRMAQSESHPDEEDRSTPSVRVVLDLRFPLHFTVERTSDPVALVLNFRRVPLRKQLVVVDPGHGGEDPGAMYQDVFEKNINLDIAKRLAKLLKKAGAKVILTRDTDVFVDLHDRPRLANEANADLFVSIHCNAMPKPNIGRGTETYYLRDDSVLMALSLQESLHGKLQLRDGGIRRRNFCVVTGASARRRRRPYSRASGTMSKGRRLVVRRIRNDYERYSRGYRSDSVHPGGQRLPSPARAGAPGKRPGD